VTVTIEMPLHRQLLQQANTVQLESFTTVLCIIDPVIFPGHVTATFNFVVHFSCGEMQMLGNIKL